MTICLNSKVNGKQPYIEDRVYYGGASHQVLLRHSQVTDIGHCMKPKIYTLGKIWKSEANGQVYHRGGLSPTLCCGAHNGVQPKVIVYEENKTPVSGEHPLSPMA